MNDIATYSPSEVSISFGGYLAKGWDTITIERDLPSFKKVMGIRGKNTRVRVGNTSATITMVIPQTSVLNTVFEQIVLQDEVTGNGRIVILIKDLLGNSVFQSDSAYIEKPAKTTYDTEISSRDWKIHCMKSGQDIGVSWGAMDLIRNVANSIF